MSTFLYPDDLWLDPPVNPDRPTVETFDFTGGSDLTVLQTADAEDSTVNFDRVGVAAGLMPFRIPFTEPVDFGGDLDSPVIAHAQFYYFDLAEGILTARFDLVDERTWDGLTGSDVGAATVLTSTVISEHAWVEGSSGTFGSGVNTVALQDAYDTGNLVLVAYFNASADASQVKFSYLTIEVLPVASGFVQATTRQFPRDDALGLGSGGRIYPPPRAGRVVGGY